MSVTAGATVAITGIILGTFGSLGEVLHMQNPWHGFQADGPNLMVVRSQRVEGASCKAWVDAFLADPRGVRIGSPENEASWKEAWKSWEPWSSDDIDAVKD